MRPSHEYYPDHDILDLITILILKVESMSAVTDLTAAVAALATEVSLAVSALQNTGGDNPAVTQAVTDINAAVQQLTDAVALVTPPAP